MSNATPDWLEELLKGQMWLNMHFKGRSEQSRGLLNNLDIKKQSQITVERLTPCQ